MRLILTLTTLTLLLPSQSLAEKQYDVVIYGGTSAGVIAAVKVAQMGKSVILIEPSKHLGGLSSGGLGATDIGNKAAIGGMSRAFYQRIKKHYANPKNWKHEKPSAFRGRGHRPNEDAAWTFEPHVAEKIFNQLIREAKVPVLFNERLNLKSGVMKQNTRINKIITESGKSFPAKIFIDATYEGDLMAKAGVSYHIGREANAKYGETLNGVQTTHAHHHQFIRKVDPYIKKGDSSSGLLHGIDPTGPGKEFSGDHRVQAYCYRLCATDVPSNRRPWPKPKNYDPAKYELLLRNFEAGDHRRPWNPVLMPNRKTDSNNNYAVSTDYIGQNYKYPDGDYATREKILRDHENYQKGLMWTLANHPRVPEKVRKHFQTWGLAKDEFTDNDNWPHQLYIREARRMVSAYVMTQHNCLRKTVVTDSVGMGAYNMDSHNVQRYVTKQGHVRNEGDVQVRSAPYPISYRSIVPHQSECSNLFAPTTLSSSHIAFGSIRMEPVFMVLAESSAVAAVHAIDQNVPVQKIDYPKLKKRLLADKQVLDLIITRRPSRVTFINPKKLKGIVADDSAAAYTGTWINSTSVGPIVGKQYKHDDNTGTTAPKSATFNIKLPKPSRYEVRYAYTPHPNRATNLPIRIQHAKGSTTVKLNQRKRPKINNTFTSLGKFTFKDSAIITVNTKSANGYVIIDAIQLFPVK